ncbi:DUF7504 family protein [Natrinema versiforme]|uniref:KaiC-like domain-containing protein n=1 Tax=Natrinema versiforme JCM 10478 TaxID=1227496 RepID=L9Y9W8_9EURY|nr:hypothetical protein [Natrinema versiforme]ELY69718.1 hypothetical protein C489_04067 [Natrinema versiforme JCM 10478]
MEDDGGAVVSDRATFARTLDALKREGSNVLLVGAAAGTHERVCQRLLGGTNRDTRYRLFVTTEGDRLACENADSDAAERIRTIDSRAVLETETESATESGVSSLGALGIQILETINEFDEDADGLEPSALRVCVGSLVPLLQEYDAETVFRLLHVLTARVDRSRGMGHYHVPLAPDHDAVALFEPLFDAVVTVRSRGGTDEQRWHLRETNTTTDWLEL